MTGPFYQYFPDETGLFTELYLPKKADFQGTLYKVLTEGFDLARVKAHFRDPAKQPTIRHLLQNYPRIEQFTDQDIDRMSQLFYGYSMYEVDGVFFRQRKGIVEERTQVIRFILQPDYDDVVTQCRIDPANKRAVVALIRDFLRTPDLKVDELLTMRGAGIRESFGPHISNYLEVLKYMEQWMDQVRLFLIGYIVHEICARILELHREKKLSMEQLEEEIWVTSFSNLAINRVKREGAGGPADEG